MGEEGAQSRSCAGEGNQAAAPGDRSKTGVRGAVRAAFTGTEGGSVEHGAAARHDSGLGAHGAALAVSCGIARRGTLPTGAERPLFRESRTG